MHWLLVDLFEKTNRVLGRIAEHERQMHGLVRGYPGAIGPEIDVATRAAMKLNARGGIERRIAEVARADQIRPCGSALIIAR
jgi:hypothetical protein